jgi:hypothetical protein
MNTTKRSLNILLLLLGLMVVALVVLGCGGQERVDLGSDDRVDTATADASADADTPVRAASDAKSKPVDACELQSSVSSSLDVIMRWPRQVISGHDTCVGAVLDSLADGFVRTGDDRYLQALDSCSAYSDGHVSEYLGGVAARLLEDRPADFLSYLARRTSPAAPIGDRLIGEWRIELSGGDSSEARSALREKIRDQVSTASLPKRERDHLAKLMRDARVDGQ